MAESEVPRRRRPRVLSPETEWDVLAGDHRRAHHQVAATGNTSLGQGAGGVDPDLDHQLERRSQALRLAQDADEILDSLAPDCQRNSDSKHQPRSGVR